MARGLPDRIRPDLEALLVGINPGLRSAALGHHFAGRNNRFWELLHESGLTPRRLSFEEDARLPDFGLGLTNLAARPTRSSGELTARDFARGRRALCRKIARERPRAVVFVGLTAYREFLVQAGSGRPRRVRCGLQRETVDSRPLFVLPNPSGRNAHYRYGDLLRHFGTLARWLRPLKSRRA